jgi:hypothetical protein
MSVELCIITPATYTYNLLTNGTSIISYSETRSIVQVSVDHIVKMMPENIHQYQYNVLVHMRVTHTLPLLEHAIRPAVMLYALG